MSVYNAVTWLLDRNVDAGRGGKVVFKDPASEITYGELQVQTCRLANLLKRLGVRREERIAMMMLDTIDFPIVFLGSIRAGIVPVPLNTLLTADQYAYVLADSRARVLFISEALYPVVKDIVGRMADLECVVVAGKNAFGHKLLSEELAKESDSFVTAETHAEEPAFWLYSSGTTGMPKGVRHIHSNLQATADTYARQVLGIRESDVCLSAAKLFFAYGLGNALTFPMTVGATTLLMPERAGNNLAFGLQNIVANGRIGIIAFRPGTGETLRITGRAEIRDDPDLLAMLGGADKPALLAIRVHVERCYFHCARSVLRAGLWNPLAWAPSQQVSFGKIIAEGLAQGPEAVAAIDESVQGAYTTRLWSNKA